MVSLIYLLKWQNKHGARVYRMPLIVLGRTRRNFELELCPNCGALNVGVEREGDDALLAGLYEVNCYKFSKILLDDSHISHY